MKISSIYCPVLLCVGLLSSRTAQAQQAPQDFSLERFRLSLDHRGILDVESGEVSDHKEWELSVFLGYEDDPLVLNNSATDERIGALVGHRLSGNLLVSFGLWDRIQLGLDLPLIGSQNGEVLAAVNQGPISNFGIGDLRIIPKIALLRPGRHGVSVALIPTLTLPTGGEESYFGSDGVSFRPELAVSVRRDRFRFGVNLAYQTRKKRILANLEIEDEWRFRAGAGILVTDALEVDATLSVGTLGKKPFDGNQDTSMEVLGGLNYLIGDRLVVFGAGGPGLASGYGTPDWRALAGLRLRGGSSSPGQSAIADERDPLERDKEDKDENLCPNDPDTTRSEGCLDEKPVGDADGDGLNDTIDGCPEKPEDLDGFEDKDGCPELDNDQDGVLDTDDDCPNRIGVVEIRGCPLPDRDGDSVFDKYDNCPDEPGTAQFQGCNKKTLVKLTGSKLEILDRVFFRTNKAKILNKSYDLLDNVAEVLIAHPEILKVEVEGHTDSRGRAAKNLKLSQKRAESVVKYLINKGVEKARLKAIGYGATRPVETNETDEGRSANRRVEFNIAGAKGNIQNAESGPGKESMDGSR